MRILRDPRFFFHGNLLYSKNLKTLVRKRLMCSDKQEQTLLPKKTKYILILDFEATCDETKIEQEIIEFPCLKINVETTLEEGRFHRYVRPIINPNLSHFCIELTGIIQEMVQEEETFPSVLKSFEEWRQRENITSDNSVYLTSGDWDLGHMIPKQCSISGLEVPKHMMEWIDIKKLYANNYKQYCNSLREIMKAFDLTFEGRPHSGIDDCLNIHKIVRKLLQLEIDFIPTTKMELGDFGKRIHYYGVKKYVKPTGERKIQN